MDKRQSATTKTPALAILVILSKVANTPTTTPLLLMMDIPAPLTLATKALQLTPKMIAVATTSSTALEWKRVTRKTPRQMPKDA